MIGDYRHGRTPATARPAARKLVVHAIGPHGPFTVSGKAAKTLRALIDAGWRGIAPGELAGWAYRLSAYCFDLRTRHGLDIATQHERHPGGWHGRYRLQSVVTIIDDPRRDG
jgi:hypothetical protein